MKSFRDYISEEVVPTALVKDGSIDIDKEEVRASINMALAKVTSDSAITPYIALNRISKALSMFHIILPKRVYLEGAKGVEVHELRQFGHKMGMNDQGEFINEVPGKYFLFIQYGMNTPMNSGGQYAYPTMAGTFRVTAKVVDPIELNRLLDVAEITVSEECNAETQQLKAKMLALKEPMKDLATDGSPSTDADVATSERKGNKKLSASELDEELSHGARELTLHADNDQQLHRSSHQPIVKNLSRKHAKGQYDHEKATKLWKYHADRAAKSYEKQHGGKFSVADRKAAASHFADNARDEHGFGSVKEESIDEASTKSQKDAMKRVLSQHPDRDLLSRITKQGADARREKKSFASAKKEIKRLKEEEQINELKKSTAASKLAKEEYEKVRAGVKRTSSGTHTLHRRNPGHKTEYHTITTERDGRKSVKTGSPKYIKKHWDKLEEKFGVYRKGGSIGEKPSTEPHKTFDSAEEAKAHAKSMNKVLSPGEKKYYGIKYHVKPIKEENNLDEKHLTPPEKAAKERGVLKLKPHLAKFEKRYGKDGEGVMYGVATKRAKQVAEKLEFDPSTEIPKNS